MHSRPQRPKKVKCIVLGSSGAGKTSIIRRYFYKTFDAHRLPTLGSDWHTARIPASSTSPLNGNDDGMKKNDVAISLQVWDTPGRERFDPKRLKPHQQQQQKPSPGASFLQQADAIMLVYDMTSSTSFIQLLKWYADLSSILDKRRPTLVVANKLDIGIQHRTTFQLQPHQNNTNNNQERVAQRDVLGLGGKYKGSDYHYEYQISRIDEDEENHKAGAGGGGGGRSDNINSHNNNNNKKGRTELTSYLADRENWTTDGSYLHSLITTEDQSHPDTEMVKLWCLRNGLEHVETSAATGHGIDEAFDILVRLALTSKGGEEEQQQQQQHEAGQQQQQQQQKQHQMTWQYNKELDLAERYSPKEEQCCLLPVFQPFIRWRNG